MINKSAITTALLHHYDDADCEEHWNDSDITDRNKMEVAKESLTKKEDGQYVNLSAKMYGQGLLTDSALKAQENEIINFINQY